MNHAPEPSPRKAKPMKPMTTSKTYIWVALAGFVVMKSGTLFDHGTPTQFAAVVTLAGFFLFVVGVFCAAVGALPPVRRRRSIAAEMQLRNRGPQYPAAMPCP